MAATPLVPVVSTIDAMRIMGVRANPLLATVAVLGALCASLVLSSRAGHADEISAVAVAAAMEKVVVDAIARSERSVVAISMFRDHKLGVGAGPPALSEVPDAFGTGVVVDASGLILTNYHVLLDKTIPFVRVAGKPLWLKAEIKAADSRSDLAVLKIVGVDAATLNLQPIRFGDASKLKKGQFVIALGNPYSIAHDGEASASWGIIANLRRKVVPRRLSVDESFKLHQFGTLIQTDAKLNLGTSGGALLNLQGEMIGLSTSLSAVAGYEKAAGYAMAVDDVFRRIVDALKQGREVEYGFLGVRPADLPHAARLRGARGVSIEDVVYGTPAARVLRRGDVVTHINGERVDSADDLMLAVGKLAAGASVRLAVLRHDRPAELRVRLAKYRIRGKQIITTKKPAWRGLRVEYASATVNPTFRERIPADCVVVQEVDTDSAASAGQLEAGMRITHVNGVPVTDPIEFRAATAGATGPVRLRVSGPDGATTVRTVAPDAG